MGKMTFLEFLADILKTIIDKVKQYIGEMIFMDLHCIKCVNQHFVRVIALEMHNNYFLEFSGSILESMVDRKVL